MNTLIATITMILVTGWPFLLVGRMAKVRPLPEPITMNEAALISVFFAIAFAAGMGTGAAYGN